MLRFLGSRRRLCDGVSRRDLLHVGGLGAFGLSLADALTLAGPAGAAPPGFGRAKRCILLFLFGSPPQHETFDPKPDAPSEIQGELKAIATRLPGVRIGERLPRIAGILDRVTVVRSLTHPYPFHGVPYALTSEMTLDPKNETKRDLSRHPFIGSVMEYLDERRAGAGAPAVPRNVALPFPVYAHVNWPLLAGPYGGYLGSQYDPIYTRFDEPGVRKVAGQEGDPSAGGGVMDPFAGVRPGARLGLGGGEAPASGERFDFRRSLLRRFDAARRLLDDPGVEAYSRQQQRALDLLANAGIREALDLEREPMRERERYGMTLFGQSTLAARRLVEAGGRFVTVFWDAWGHFANGWDTHIHHYPRLKDYLLPGLDQTLSALLLDLETRGMLDDTLVLCLSEHGRTPKIDNVAGGGRGHWSRAYSALFAGGGIARGRVVGSTDSAGGEVDSTPVSPKDVLATAYHLLGIDPDTELADRQGRPQRIAADGRVRTELLG